MVVGKLGHFNFDGILEPRVAFQIGRFVTMAILLNERANSAWVRYTPVTVGFRVAYENEFNAYHVFIGLENTTRNPECEIGMFTLQEDAEKLIEVVKVFMVDNPL